MSVVTTPAHVGLRDHLVGAGIALAYLVVLLATAGDLAMSRDESFYVVAAEDYGNWYAQLFERPGAGVHARFDRSPLGVQQRASRR